MSPLILVVDDSPSQAEEMRFLLEDAGFLVNLAPDGEAALDALRRGTAPDLIVTDLQMPRMDGMALVEAVRQGYPSIPTILVTAAGSEAIAARALRSGAAGYVPKRHLGLKLVPTIRQALDAVVTIDRTSAHRQMVSVASRFVVANEPELIPPLIRYVEEQMGLLAVGEAWERVRIGMALYEAMVNAMERGNLEIPSSLQRSEHPAYWELAQSRRGCPPYRERRVTVDVQISPLEVSFVVKDEGPGFDYTSLPESSDPAGMAGDGGRGLRLIRTFMDRIEHNAAGNEITMSKSIGSGNVSPPA